MEYIVKKFFDKPGVFFSWFQNQILRESKPTLYSADDFVVKNKGPYYEVTLSPRIYDLLAEMAKNHKHDMYADVNGDAKTNHKKLLENLAIVASLSSNDRCTYLLKVSMECAKTIQTALNRHGTSWQQSMSRMWVYHAYAMMSQEELSSQSKNRFSAHTGKRSASLTLFEVSQYYSFNTSSDTALCEVNVSGLAAYAAANNILQNDKFCEMLENSDEKSGQAPVEEVWNVWRRGQAKGNRIFKVTTDQLKAMLASRRFISKISEGLKLRPNSLTEILTTLIDIRSSRMINLAQGQLSDWLNEFSEDPAIYDTLIKKVLFTNDISEDGYRFCKVFFSKTPTLEDVEWAIQVHKDHATSYASDISEILSQKPCFAEGLIKIWRASADGMLTGKTLIADKISEEILTAIESLESSKDALNAYRSRAAVRNGLVRQLNCFEDAPNGRMTSVTVKEWALIGLHSDATEVAENFAGAVLSANALKEEQEFTKIATVLFALKDLVYDLSFDLSNTIERVKQQVRGWYDLSKVLPIAAQWILIEYRHKKKEISAKTFIAEYFSLAAKTDGFLQDNPLCYYSPYDGRGGFSFQTYLAICEEFKVNPWTQCTDFQEVYPWDSEFDSEDQEDSLPNNAMHLRIAAMRLAYLYGADHASAIAAVHKEVESQRVTGEAGKKRMLLKLVVHPLIAMPADSIKIWRPFLIKYPKLLKLGCFLNKAKLPEESDTETTLIKKLIANRYENVPEHLLVHMIHAMENNWQQEVVDEFVDIATNQASSSKMIPNVTFHLEGVKVRHLENADPVALYVGELSGCCQHINDGAGNDAAVQSYTEDWCSVLMIESSGSDKLLAQSFIWLSENKKYVVLDSIESVLDETNDPSVKKLIYPALLTWVSKMKDIGYKVCISSTSYGITDELVAFMKQDSSVKLTEIDTPSSYDELEYSDVDSTCFKISVS